MTHFYSFSYEYILDLPLKVFTLYNENVSRIKAEEDLRMFSMLCSSQASGEYVKKHYRSLEKEMGDPIEIEKGMDPDAMEKLAALSGKINGR